jgi:hypothetical protein
MGYRDHARYALAKSVAHHDCGDSTGSLDSRGGIIREVTQSQPFRFASAAAHTSWLQTRGTIAGRNNGAREVFRICSKTHPKAI